MLTKSIQQALPNSWIIFNDKDLLRGSGHSRDYKSPSCPYSTLRCMEPNQKRDVAPANRLRTRVNILNGFLNPCDSIFRIGMGTKKLRRRITLAGFSQYLHHSDQFLRVVTGIIDEAHSQEI